jgi:hypothetical protein
VCVCIYACMYVRLCVCMYIYMYISNSEDHKLKSPVRPAGTRIIDSWVVRGLHDLNKFFRRGVYRSSLF